MTVGERLAWAVERSGMSLSALHRALHAQKVPASSYGAVWNFVSNKQEPPLSWLIAAAEVLGVREWWLVLGEGQPTEAEEAAHRAREDYDNEAEASVFKRALLEPFGTAPHAFAESAVASLFEVWSEVMGHHDPYELVDPGFTKGESLAYRVTEAVIEPIYRLGSTLDESLSYELEAYITEVSQALKRYLAAERRARGGGALPALRASGSGRVGPGADAPRAPKSDVGKGSVPQQTTHEQSRPSLYCEFSHRARTIKLDGRDQETWWITIDDGLRRRMREFQEGDISRRDKVAQEAKAWIDKKLRVRMTPEGPAWPYPSSVYQEISHRGHIIDLDLREGRTFGDPEEWWISLDAEPWTRLRDAVRLGVDKLPDRSPISTEALFSQDAQQARRDAMAWLDARLGPEELSQTVGARVGAHGARTAAEQQEVDRLVREAQRGPQKWAVTVTSWSQPMRPLEFEHRGHVVRLEPRRGALWATADDGGKTRLRDVRPGRLSDVVATAYRKAVEWLDAKLGTDE